MNIFKKTSLVLLLLIGVSALASKANAYWDYYSSKGWTLGDGDYDGKYQSSSQGSDGTVTINCLITLTRCFSIGGNWIHLGVVQQGNEPPIQYIIPPKP